MFNENKIKENRVCYLQGKANMLGIIKFEMLIEGRKVLKLSEIERLLTEHQAEYERAWNKWADESNIGGSRFDETGRGGKEIMRNKFEDINDSLWLDALYDKQYYEGKDNAHTVINKMLDRCKTPEELRAGLLECQRESETRRDTHYMVGEDWRKDWFYYDGEATGYRETIEALDKKCRQEK